MQQLDGWSSTAAAKLLRTPLVSLLGLHNQLLLSKLHLLYGLRVLTRSVSCLPTCQYNYQRCFPAWLMTAGKVLLSEA